MQLESRVDCLPGVGPARAKALGKLGILTLRDLLSYFPRDYEDRSVKGSIADLPEDVPVCFEAMVTESFYTARLRRGLDVTKGKLSDHTAQVTVSFFHGAYVANALQYGESYVFYGKLTGKGRARQMTNPYFEKLGEGKLVGGIIPIYPLTAGISHAFLAGLIRRVLPLAHELEETLPPWVREEYQLAQVEFTYESVHFPRDWEALGLARRRLVFEEFLLLRLGLSLLRERRREEGGLVFTKGDLTPFLQSLPFSPTGAQRRAMEEMAKDMGAERPMNRLLQGDVGSGKTVVAAGLIWLAFQNGCQSALMAPTDLLARQHYRTMEGLLAPFGLRLGLLTGSLTEKQKRSLREAAALGEVDLLIGTHALITQEVAFSRLGLVVTDEQHRFGVLQRAALTAKGGEATPPHALVMSATPIPRTLALLVFGDLDLSILDELPPGRSPVETYLIGEDKRGRLYDFIRTQVGEGRQVYVVCPTVEEGGPLELKAAEQYGKQLKEEVFPDLSVGIIHGRMKPREKERVMEAFVGGELAILVSTTVIEVGVDVPNASLMVVENAERFGLSQLHQLRGRVGRGALKAYCILVSDSKSQQSKERLSVLKGSTDGFHIAEEDLKLRGPGDFFGARQHGLPQLKLANLASDLTLLEAAQAAAFQLLEKDPNLEGLAHQPLRRQVQELFSQAGASIS